VKQTGYTGPVTFSNRILKIGNQKGFCRAVNALESNPTWRDAVWQQFYAEYWSAAMSAVKARGYASALTIGALVDCALNQGAQGPDSLAWVLKRTGSARNETEFLADFLKVRMTVVDTHQFNQPPNGLSRVRQWQELLAAGAMSLTDCDALIEKVTSWVMH